MPRAVRIEYPGAMYHVMCRGDRKELIFLGDDDRRLILETLESMCGRTGAIVHSYVLMPNHYHLLLETPEPNLVAGMKWFQGTYTQRFNCRHGLSGHLFQGRYRAIPIDAEDVGYFRTASEYIHLNPARAGLLGKGQPRLKSYPWSSLPSFAEQANLPPWLSRARVFDSVELPDEGRGSRRRYAGYMEERAKGGASEVEGEEDSEWNRLRRGWYLGSDKFRDRLQERIERSMKGKKRESFESHGLRRHDEREARRLLRAGLGCLQVSIGELRRRNQNDPCKQALAWLIKSRTVVSDAWICRQMEMGSRSNVARAVSAYRDPVDRERRGLKKKLTICAD